MIEFVNIRSNEKVRLESPEQIAAYINSSDLHVNSNLGQDFGWRLAPEVILRMDQMREDPVLLERISTRTGVPVDEMTTIHLVQQISYEAAQAERTKTMQSQREPEFKKSYEQEIEELRQKNLATAEVTGDKDTAPTKKK